MGRTALASDPKTRIVEVAEVMFANYGFDGLTTRELADELGLNIATIHYHYGSKQELYKAAVSRSFTRQRATVQRLLERCEEIDKLTPETFAVLLDSFIDDLLQTTNEHPWAARLFVRWALTHGRGDPLLDVGPGDPVMPLLQDVLDRAKAEDIIDHVDATVLTTGLAWAGYGYFASHTKDATECLEMEDLEALRSQLRKYLFGSLNLTHLLQT
ncbi:MAG: TetR family transcriptional regulator [Acidimicrobiia bacterium]|nr:TetR family transcriptional regulator [Acidimicrobiia bacterium]